MEAKELVAEIREMMDLASVVWEEKMDFLLRVRVPACKQARNHALRRRCWQLGDRCSCYWPVNFCRRADISWIREPLPS